MHVCVCDGVGVLSLFVFLQRASIPLKLVGQVEEQGGGEMERWSKGIGVLNDRGSHTVQSGGQHKAC